MALGTTDELRPLAGATTRVIDLKCGTVMPGINDSHLHLSWDGLSRPPYSLDLTGRSLADARGLVAERARTLGAEGLIRGGGWDERWLSGAGQTPLEPTAADLDDVSEEHPTVLEHWTRHAVWANSAALRRAGITQDTTDPDGDRIVRLESGEPTGHLIETATDLVRRAVPEPASTERREAIVAATRELSRRGVTSITDPVVGPDLLRDYISLRNSSAMSARLSVLLRWDWPSVTSSVLGLRRVLGCSGLSSGLGVDWLRIGGCKLFADGVPGLGTAWMSRPTLHGDTGGLVTAGDTPESRRQELLDMIELLHRHRLQVQVHATGDLACEAGVEAFDRALQRDPWPEARHVVIHANFVPRAAAERLVRHGLICNVNSLIKWQRPTVSPPFWTTSAGITKCRGARSPGLAFTWQTALTRRSPTPTGGRCWRRSSCVSAGDPAR